MHRVTQVLAAHYEQCLERHGPNPRGMDWGSDFARLELRFAAIGRAIGLEHHANGARPSLLDAGCGCGLLLDYLQARHPARFEYFGMDASAKMIAAAKVKHPATHDRWFQEDITAPQQAPVCDWVIANGLLTERRETPHDEMVSYAQRVLTGMFGLCQRGIVFNVLSSHVNFRDPVLFYWDPGEAMTFCARRLSRHIVLWHDTELYEYFCCVRREPWSPGSAGPSSASRTAAPAPSPPAGEGWPG
jgi:SAM-dependent methyltransferase